MNLARLAASVFYFSLLRGVWAADGAGVLKISLLGLRMNLLERMRLKRALKWLILNYFLLSAGPQSLTTVFLPAILHFLSSY